MLSVRMKRRNLVVSTEIIIDLAFVLFFSNSFFRTAINSVFHSSTIGTVIVLGSVYGLVFIACLVNPQKYLKIDFILLYLSILMFFFITVTLHPDYLYYYTREEYGVWDYVLIPYKGLYSYLFIRLLNSPEKVKRNLKISGWIMYIYFVYLLYIAKRRGFWYGVAGSNNRVEMNYSVSFGYEVLFFELIFLYAALTDRKLRDIIASAVGLIMILAGGSRGPILFIGVFIIIFLLNSLKKSKRKFLYVLFSIALMIVAYFTYTPFLYMLSALLNKLGFSSRFIELLANGSITGDSGRSKIWLAAIDMIQEKPLGYGAMGARSVISSYIVAGYPHSVILEILIDFGVIFGSLILIAFLICAIRIIFNPEYDEWCSVFIPLFSCSCALLISMTYWSFPSFWSCIAIGVNCFFSHQRSNSIYREGKK